MSADDWDELNKIPKDIRDQFYEIAVMLRNRGFKKVGAAFIFERIRWERWVDKGDREFKCNNNWRAILARWVMHINSGLSGLFDVRDRPSRRG